MKRYTFIAVLMALVCAVSCDHKELCPYHREHAHRYHVDTTGRSVVADPIGETIGPRTIFLTSRCFLSSLVVFVL